MGKKYPIILRMRKQSIAGLLFYEGGYTELASTPAPSIVGLVFTVGAWVDN